MAWEIILLSLSWCLCLSLSSAEAHNRTKKENLYVNLSPFFASKLWEVKPGSLHSQNIQIKLFFYCRTYFYRAFFCRFYRPSLTALCRLFSTFFLLTFLALIFKWQRVTYGLSPGFAIHSSPRGENMSEGIFRPNFELFCAGRQLDLLSNSMTLIGIA